jgi:hypothetical protein
MFIPSLLHVADMALTDPPENVRVTIMYVLW